MKVIIQFNKLSQPFKITRIRKNVVLVLDTPNPPLHMTMGRCDKYAKTRFRKASGVSIRWQF